MRTFLKFEFILLLLFTSSISAQEEIITTVNPSFEDVPHKSSTPNGWIDCGPINFPKESPPDIQPGFWKVELPASDGSSYLGMVTRDVETYESVSTILSSPLEAGKCYSFDIDLARSDTYLSQSQMNREMTEYIKPIVLRIWGANEVCEIEELLVKSEEIKNNNWKGFEFFLKPKESYKFIILEAFWQTPTLIPYNGHILLDNIQDILLIQCEE